MPLWHACLMQKASACKHRHTQSSCMRQPPAPDLTVILAYVNLLPPVGERSDLESKSILGIKGN